MASFKPLARKNFKKVVKMNNPNKLSISVLSVGMAIGTAFATRVPILKEGGYPSNRPF